MEFGPIIPIFFGFWGWGRSPGGFSRNSGMLTLRFFPDPGKPEEIHGIRADAELGEGLQAAGKGAGSQLP